VQSSARVFSTCYIGAAKSLKPRGKACSHMLLHSKIAQALINLISHSFPASLVSSGCFVVVSKGWHLVIAASSHTVTVLLLRLRNTQTVVYQTGNPQFLCSSLNLK
jgi:hypothetical protein